MSSQSDLPAIQEKFQQMYKKSLAEAVRSDTSGDFRKLLLAILHWKAIRNEEACWAATSWLASKTAFKKYGISTKEKNPIYFLSSWEMCCQVMLDVGFMLWLSRQMYLSNKDVLKKPSVNWPLCVCICGRILWHCSFWVDFSVFLSFWRLSLFCLQSDRCHVMALQSCQEKMDSDFLSAHYHSSLNNLSAVN